jgi:spore germination protein YaaH
MTYDQNGSSSTEIGPVAGLDWVINNMNYLLQTLHIPATKLSMGIPAYGYDWNLTTPAKPPMISWNQIANLPTLNNVKYYDQSTSSPYLTYTTSNGDSHKVYYENTTSIRAKGASAASLGLAGVSVFALEKDNPDFWPALIAGVNQTAVSIGTVNSLLLRQ